MFLCFELDAWSLVGRVENLFDVVLQRVAAALDVRLAGQVRGVGLAREVRGPPAGEGREHVREAWLDVDLD